MFARKVLVSVAALCLVLAFGVSSAFGAQVPVYAGQFASSPTTSSPYGVAVAPDGSVFVGSNGLQHFSATGDFLGTWGPAFSAMGVAVNADGSVFVADDSHNVIQVWKAGECVTMLGSPGTGIWQFKYPSGVAVAGWTVYVADAGNSRIQYGLGRAPGAWGAYGTGAGQFREIHDIAVAPDGTLYVADAGNSCIQYFSADGAPLGSWSGTGDEQFWPTGVAVGPDGTVYVADAFRRRVLHFSATGELLGKWGTSGTGDGQFVMPTGIAVSADGSTVYVADAMAHRVQYFRYDSTPPTTTIPGGPFGTWTNSSPVSLSFDATDGPKGSGVAHTYYALNGGDAVTYTGSPVLVTSEGTTSVSYWSVDSAGNTETVNSATILLDTTPPALSITSPADGAAYYLHQIVRATWSASDSLSGIATSSATVADGAVLDTSVVGTHTVAVSATDVAGNPVTETVTYAVVTPKQLFGDLLAFYDASIANKNLVGTGSYPKVSQVALRALIRAASDFNDAYVRSGNRVWLSAAAETMRGVYLLCDGKASPSDLVTGPNRGELAGRVSTLRTALGAQ